MSRRERAGGSETVGESGRIGRTLPEVRRLATFRGGLAVIALGALAIRLAYVVLRRGAVVQG
ncbi:MAG: hypothetical protein AVDCRST_MAG13-2429, partial [uncultured Solirubrobacteraceae bacterium]